MARWSTPHYSAVFRSHLSVWGRQRVHGRVRRGTSRMVGVIVRTRGCTVGGRPSKGESVCKRENKDSSSFRCSLSVTLPSMQSGHVLSISRSYAWTVSRATDFANRLTWAFHSWLGLMGALSGTSSDVDAAVRTMVGDRTKPRQQR